MAILFFKDPIRSVSIGTTGALFFNPEGIRQQNPVRTKQCHNLPVDCASEPIFGNQTEFFPKTSDVFKPDFMFHPILCIVKMRGHGNRVKFNGNIVVDGKLYGCLQGDGRGSGTSLPVRERPVVAVIGDSQIDFVGDDFAHSIFHHSADFIERSDRKRRAVSIRSSMPLPLFRKLRPDVKGKIIGDQLPAGIAFRFNVGGLFNKLF